MSGTISDKSETHTLKSSQKEENFREKNNKTKQNQKTETSIYRNFSATTSTFNQSPPWLATNPSLDPT